MNEKFPSQDTNLPEVQAEPGDNSETSDHSQVFNIIEMPGIEAPKQTEEVQQFESYIDGIPSIQAAQKDHTLTTSDHVPVLAAIDTPKGKIKILSWNVLENDDGNGFAPNGHRCYGEDTEGKQGFRAARHARIAQTLKQFVDGQNPDFVTLQEISAGKEWSDLIKVIQGQLGEAYKCVIANDSIVSNNGCITLYRADTYQPIVEEGDTFSSSYYVGGNTTKFQMVGDDDFEIRVTNTHHKFAQDITHHEESIRSCLQGNDGINPPLNKEKNTLSIISGDFNGTSGRRDSQLQKLTTSVAPSFFRKEPEVQKAYEQSVQVQGAWAIDAVFSSYRPANHEGDSPISQAELTLLNPRTSQPYTATELEPIDTSKLHPVQAKEITEIRMAICIDESFKQEQIIEHQYSIFDYEQKLQTDFNQPRIRVRRAVNLNNEKGIGIIIPAQLYNYYLQLNDQRFENRCIEDWDFGQQFYALYIKDEDISELVKEMQFAADNPALVELGANIQILKSQEHIDQPTKDVFDKFFSTMKKEVSSVEADAIILDRFNKFTKKLKERPLTEEEIDAYEEELLGALQVEERYKNQAIVRAFSNVFGRVKIAGNSSLAELGANIEILKDQEHIDQPTKDAFNKLFSRMKKELSSSKQPSETDAIILDQFNNLTKKLNERLLTPEEIAVFHKEFALALNGKRMGGAKVTAINDVIAAVQKFAQNNRSLAELGANIEILKAKEHIDQPTKNAFDTLFSVMKKGVCSGKQPNQTDAIILDKFNKLAKQLHKSPLTTIEIAAFCKELGFALYGKLPMSKAKSTAIGAVIGAVIGLAIGFAIGAALTFWAGGVGAVPAMFIGMAIGASLLGGAGTGAACGFFKANRAHNKDKVERPLRKEKIKQEMPEIVGAMEAIETLSPGR